MESTLRVQIPAKTFLSPTLATLFCGRLVPNFLTELFCKQSPVFINSRQFMEFFDRYFHIPLPIVTKHELGLPFPPRNLRIKFGANPSTIFLVIVVKDRHTDKPTPVKTYCLTFAGIIMTLSSWKIKINDVKTEINEVILVLVQQNVDSVDISHNVQSKNDMNCQHIECGSTELLAWITSPRTCTSSSRSHQSASFTDLACWAPGIVLQWANDCKCVHSWS